MNVRLNWILEASDDYELSAADLRECGSICKLHSK